MAGKQKMNYGDLLGNLLSKGVSTVDKNKYEKDKTTIEKDDKKLNDSSKKPEVNEENPKSKKPRAKKEVETKIPVKDDPKEVKVNETKEEYLNNNVTHVSAEEVAAAKADFEKLKTFEPEVEKKEEEKKEEQPINLEIENETTPVKREFTPEELKKQKRDEELLSKLDEQTRKEYEYLARKYSRNPIKNNANEIIIKGEYNEIFDFEKRTDIKKVSFAAKKKPLIISLVALTLVLAIFLPLYFFVFNKEKVEPVVLTGVTINQNNLYQYSGTYIELDNVCMVASYSDGSKKVIKCTEKNLISKPSYISNDLFINKDTNSTGANLQFEHEGKIVTLKINICKVSLSGIDARVYNTQTAEVGKLFSYKNFDIFKSCSSSGTVDADGVERLPSTFNKIFDESEYSNLLVTITKNGNAYVSTNFANMKARGGVNFDGSGEYIFNFIYQGKMDSITITVA